MKKTIKFFFYNLLAHLPGHEAKAKNIYRRLRYEKRNLALRFKMFFQKYHIPDPEQIYWIDPNRIIYHTNYIKNGKTHFKDRVFDMVRDKGRVYPGDWDLSSHKFTDLDAYKAIEQRILHGKEWEETIFYKTELAQIEAGQTTWSCHNREDWNERCRSLDLLIQSITENGYVFAHQLKSGEGTLGPFLRNEMTEEITVNIGRDGQYLFQDGRHRLAIVKILGLECIPVKVLVRHKRWQELREELISMAKQNRRATKMPMLDQPAIHPDLSNIPAAPLCEDRFFAMKKSLRCTAGSVLDLGANLCYFCHKFEDLGFDCYAIESDHEIVCAAEEIKIAEGKNFTILVGSFFDSHIQEQIHGKQFDIVLAFNIFHNFFRTKTKFTQLKKWLQNLRLKTMFFEQHLPNQEQMNDCYLDLTEEEYVEFILKETSLNDFEIIHQAPDGRRVYRLY